MQDIFRVTPSLDRVNIDPSSTQSTIEVSGQHRFRTSDYWEDQRWSPKHFLLSWADQHVIDQRFKFYEDDFIQDVYPEINSPWKFPDRIYVASNPTPEPSPSGLDGFMLEPPYYDPDPSYAPSGSKHHMVQDPALPEFRLRLVEASGIPVKAITWGPDKNIPKNTKMLIAPYVWQGSKAPDLGEIWEIQSRTKTVPLLNDDGDLIGSSGQLIHEYNNFPANPNMPYGDPEPIWNDGLDDKRYGHNKTNREAHAHRRGTSDRLVNRWGEYTKATQATGFNPEGELEYNTNAPITDSKSMFLNAYNFQALGSGQITWADPAHFNEVNVQNFPRQMTSCLTCFNKDKCRAANSLHKTYPENADGKVGSLGFLRNHYADVPAALNPATVAGAMYASSFCMYSTGSVFESGFYSKPTEQEQKNIATSTSDELKHILKKYDSVSDLCHVNGMSRRAVEYDGHYRLLVEEIGAVIMRDMNDLIGQALTNQVYLIPMPTAAGYLPCIIEPYGNSYNGDRLYKLKWVGVSAFPAIDLGQYGAEYPAGNMPGGEPIIAWFTVRYDYGTYKPVVNRVWGYIWYISNHTDKQYRTKIRRLVELKADYGRFYGNAMEVRSQADFSGGITPSSLMPFPSGLEAKRGVYVEVIPGRWIWDEDGFNLKSHADGKYINPSGASASGLVAIKGMPGDIIPADFMTYVPPKVIKWEYSKNDRNTQTNIGKTRFWYNEEQQFYQRGVGDFDDLFYHLSYQEPNINENELIGGFNFPAAINRNAGAMKNYLFPNAPGKGYYDRWTESSEFSSPTPSSINTTQRSVVIHNTYADIAPSGSPTEPNSINYNDVALASDMQHARNFTAPIFGYELSPDIPKHEIVKPDYYFQRMDWARREIEPLEVAAQREYSPVPAVWCFAQNSENREVRFNINLGTGQVEGAEGNYPIKLIWNPAGRVWWHRKGLLGCMIEKKPDGSIFTQDGIAVINLWRRFVPHHMEVVKAYLFMEPTLEHNLGATIQIGDRILPGFVPFDGISLQYDTSDRKMAVGEDWQWANYTNRVHKGNQFLGGRIVGADVNAQMDSPEIWEHVKESSPRILGNWNFPHNAPLNWSGRYSTVGYSDWDLYHRYDSASLQNDWFILDNLYLTLNGNKLTSVDPDDSSTFSQRDPKWYNTLGEMYEDDKNAFDDTTPGTRKRFYNNANVFSEMNRSTDGGEGEAGKPDEKGKGYGFSRRGGGWKARYIFDITPYVQKAYNKRFDAEFISVTPSPTRRKSWEEE